MDLMAIQTISLGDVLRSFLDHRRSGGKRYPLASVGEPSVDRACRKVGGAARPARHRALRTDL